MSEDMSRREFLFTLVAGSVIPALGSCHNQYTINETIGNEIFDSPITYKPEDIIQVITDLSCVEDVMQNLPVHKMKMPEKGYATELHHKLENYATARSNYCANIRENPLISHQIMKWQHLYSQEDKGYVGILSDSAFAGSPNDVLEPVFWADSTHHSFSISPENPLFAKHQLVKSVFPRAFIDRDGRISSDGGIFGTRTAATLTTIENPGWCVDCDLNISLKEQVFKNNPEVMFIALGFNDRDWMADYPTNEGVQDNLEELENKYKSLLIYTIERGAIPIIIPPSSMHLSSIERLDAIVSAIGDGSREIIEKIFSNIYRWWIANEFLITTIMHRLNLPMISGSNILNTTSPVSLQGLHYFENPSVFDAFKRSRSNGEEIVSPREIPQSIDFDHNDPDNRVLLMNKAVLTALSIIAEQKEL